VHLNKGSKILLATFLIAILVIALVNALAGPSGNAGLFSTAPKKFTTSELYDQLKNREVKTADWQQTELRGELKDGTKFTAVVPANDSAAAIELQKRLDESGAKWNTLGAPIASTVGGILSILIAPLLIFALLWFFFIRPAQMGGNQAMNFGRSKARRVGESGPKITFEDVAGIDEAKQELYEIVDFLKNTKKYTALGAKIPKGVLLTGPPGVGKTHLARAIAGEAGVPFFHISGSDFVEMFVGVGAARVRDLFETAKAHRPSLIFVDEIDAVGRQRGAGLGGGHDEREQTLNQLLVEMDGFDPNSGVIMIAATNRPDVLDPALLRPGRFDRQVVVDAPDAKGRELILKIHAKGKPFDNDVKMEIIAKRTPGFTGADLANTLNEAALLAARRNKAKISMDEIEESLDRVMVGPARLSKQMIAKDRELTAYHEAGHAVVGELLEHCDPIHKVTILPRGMAMGITWSLPDTEKMSVSRSELMDRIAMTLGGLVAEEVVFSERWTGASSDLQYVTRIARAMICEYGMSDRLGTLAIGRRHSNPFLGRDYAEDRDYSEEVARQVDEEVKDLVEKSHQRATELIIANRDKLDALAKALLDRETLDREDFLIVMAGEELPPVKTTDDNSNPPAVEPEPQKNPEISGPSSTPRFEPGPA
jgi:cell division protease FtsH